MDVDSDEPVKEQKFETLDELHQKYKVLEVAFEKLKLMEIELLSDADATEEMVKNANDKSNFAKSRLDQLYEAITDIKETRNRSSFSNDPASGVTRWSSFVNTKISRSDLPRLRLSTSSTFNTDNSFVSLDAFFDNFVRVFRLNQVDLNSYWKDYMSFCIGDENCDWYRQSVLNNRHMSWTDGKQLIRERFETPTRSMYLFKQLMCMKQNAGESVRQFATRFSMTAEASQVADGNVVARIFLSCLHDSLEVNASTLLLSNVGPNFLVKLVSFRQVENLMPDLKTKPKTSSESYNRRNSNRSSGFVSKNSRNDRQKQYGKTSNSRDNKRQRYNNAGSSEQRLCRYCDKPWFHQHRCQEFLMQKNNEAIRRLELVRSYGKEDDHPANQAWRKFGLDHNLGNDGSDDIKGNICMIKQSKEGNNY